MIFEKIMDICIIQRKRHGLDENFDYNGIKAI